MATRTPAPPPSSLPDKTVRAIWKALADPSRFEIFRQIAASESASCSALREGSPITSATLSHHLKELESAGLIELTRSGKFVHASVHRPTWRAFLAGLKSL